MIRFLLIIIFLIIFFIVTIPIVLSAFLIGLFNKHLRDIISFKCVQYGFRFIAFISGIKPTVKGKENIPEDTAVLYVANHNSFFDVLIGYATVPNLTGFIAKKEFEKIPGLNWWMYLVNCLFLDRSDIKAGLKTILQAADYVKNGISIFVFPEGTRSTTGRMGDFKEGAMKVASKANCPIIPIAFTGTADVLENQFPKIKPVPVTITFGEPIYPNDLAKEDKKFLGAYTKNVIQELLDKENAK